MATNVTFTLKRAHDSALVGTIEHKGFWGLTQAQAADALLPVIREAFPQVGAESLAFGTNKAEGKEIKNLGGDVYVGTVPTGANPASAGTRTATPTTTRKAPGAPTRDERAIAWLMDGRMSTHTLEQAFEAVDALMSAELEAEHAASDVAVRSRMESLEKRLREGAAQYQELWSKLYTSTPAENAFEYACTTFLEALA